jgi:hypothetical protein
MPLVFMIALSNRLPFRLMKPALAFSGAATERMTSGFSLITFQQFSPIVLPLTVIACGCGSSSPFINSITTAGTPPAW